MVRGVARISDGGCWDREGEAPRTGSAGPQHRVVMRAKSSLVVMVCLAIYVMFIWQCLVSKISKYHHCHDQHRTGKPVLCTRLSLLLDGKCLEVWVSGQCMYAELLDDSAV